MQMECCRVLAQDHGNRMEHLCRNKPLRICRLFFVRESVQKIAQISLSNFQKMVSSVCLTIPGGGKEILPPSISYFVRRHGQFEILRVGTRGVNSKNILFDHLFSISDMDLDIFYYFFGFRYM
ncbi:hypothetical protein SORBI_3004G199800 [Sorghum bicolor]|uniref:Uncharacterized protein n=1 Tax=Sorghum bicolor TaxID=4558 RepID=A0A194YRT3_SORBI|nr:hypothetical protein SORBI_3004G199800 [Sorghum bicolor]